MRSQTVLGELPFRYREANGAQHRHYACVVVPTECPSDEHAGVEAYGQEQA